MDEILIRRANAADFEDIYRFVCALAEKEFDKAQMQEYYVACIASPANIYLIAQCEGRAVGYASCHGQVLLHHCGPVYEIQEMYVADAYRSRHAGAKLLAEIEAIVSQRGCVSLEVSSNKRRQRAHGFYTSNGFEHTSYKFVKQLLK